MKDAKVRIVYTPVRYIEAAAVAMAQMARQQKRTKNMATKSPRSQTAYAKIDAELLRDNRRHYRQYDADVKRYGRPVADFNSGFVKGWEDGFKKGKQKAKAK